MDAAGVRPMRGGAHSGAVWTALGVVGAIICAIWLLPSVTLRPSAEWVLLAVLALIAEMLPGEVGLRKTPLRFTLPFIAGVCVAYGPTAAWLTDITVILAAAVGGGALSGRPLPFHEIIRSSIAASFASTLAACAFVTTKASIADPELQLLASAVVYVIAYTAVSPVLSSRLFKRRTLEAPPGLLVFILFICLGLASAVLVADGAIYLTPVVLGPILAIRSLLASRARLSGANESTVGALALMLQRAHPYTHRHIERVASISEEVALRLGLSPTRARLVRQAAVLHDIGKIAIDEDILDLPRKLTDTEYEQVKLHASYGGEILAQVDSMQEVAHWIRHHHERPDGRGYPAGLLDPEIPLESKIIAAVDAFDAMTGGMEGRDGRPFRAPMPIPDALDELERCAGSQFDAVVVQAFREVVGA